MHFASEHLALALAASKLAAVSCDARCAISIASTSVGSRDLPGDGAFACNASALNDGAQPCSALAGGQSPLLPRFRALGFPGEAETTGRERRGRVGKVAVEAIAQAATVAQTSHALDTAAEPDAVRTCQVGYLGDDFYRGPPMKGDRRGWNGLVPVVEPEFESGVAPIEANRENLVVPFGDVRRAQCVECSTNKDRDIDRPVTGSSAPCDREISAPCDRELVKPPSGGSQITSQGACCRGQPAVDEGSPSFSLFNPKLIPHRQRDCSQNGERVAIASNASYCRRMRHGMLLPRRLTKLPLLQDRRCRSRHSAYRSLGQCEHHAILDCIQEPVELRGCPQ